MITIVLLAALQHAGPSTAVGFGTSDSYRPPADLEAGDGDVALTHLKATGELMHPLDPQHLFRFMATAEALRFDWSSATPGLPEELSVLRLETMLLHVFDSRWTGIAYASTGFHYEEEAEAADGATYAGALGALYRFGPELTVGGFLGASTRLEDGAHVILLPYLEWRPAARWSLKTDYRDGVGVELSHALAEGSAWALATRASYGERRFRLAEDSIRPDGLFEDSRTSITVGIRFQPSHGLSASLVVGVDVSQRFAIEDERGRAEIEFESRPGPFVGFQFSSMF